MLGNLEWSLHCMDFMWICSCFGAGKDPGWLRHCGAVGLLSFCWVLSDPSVLAGFRLLRARGIQHKQILPSTGSLSILLFESKIIMIIQGRDDYLGHFRVYCHTCGSAIDYAPPQRIHHAHEGAELLWWEYVQHFSPYVWAPAFSSFGPSMTVHTSRN